MHKDRARSQRDGSVDLPPGAYMGGAASSRRVHLAAQRLIPSGRPDPLAILQVQPNHDTADVKRASLLWPSSCRWVLRAADA
uniref:Uncharacterized protein n=2 Tax=Aegilops tauschii subsp. strangulata TaxID=200361 RepID=A0A453C3T6_AEGTS